ncbi:MAG: UvrB/UvrC motif-containing protein, partial [Candidatus Korobacteraceae bacterium]
MPAQRIEFVPDRDSELFNAAPASAAVFVLRGNEGSEPYVGKTSNLRRRLQRLLGAVEGQSRKLNLRDRVRQVEWTPTGSDFEASLLLYKTLRAEFPASYEKRLRLRFAPLVKLILDNPYPRATVTTRISGMKSNARYYGPFPTRVAAEKFANDSLDLFKMRRCVDDLHPDPAFPGCIYSEMKMCLAPCFKGCTDEEYAAEVERVQQFFASGGQSLLREIERQRDEASANLDFEGAAALHARLEKVKAVVAQLHDIVRP